MNLPLDSIATEAARSGLPQQGTTIRTMVMPCKLYRYRAVFTRVRLYTDMVKLPSDGINPYVVRAMAEIGYDISGNTVDHGELQSQVPVLKRAGNLHE